MPRSWASGQLDTKMLGKRGSAGTKKLSGHPSWTSGNLGDWTRPEKGHGVASRLRVQTENQTLQEGAVRQAPAQGPQSQVSSLSSWEASHAGPGDH